MAACARQAWAARQPARLRFGTGSCGFAVSRRRIEGGVAGDQATALATLVAEETLAATDHEAASAPSEATRPTPAVETWTADGLQALADAYRAERGAPRFDPEARNLRHTYVTPSEDGRTWRVQQMLVDAEMLNDWVAEFGIDLAASREAALPVMRLERIGPLV